MIPEAGGPVLRDIFLPQDGKETKTRIDTHVFQGRSGIIINYNLRGIWKNLFYFSRRHRLKPIIFHADEKRFFGYF